MRVKKDKLLRFIRSKEMLTFPEIEDFFRKTGVDYQGDTAIRGKMPEGKVLWYGWNRKTARAFLELYNDGKIFLYANEEAPSPPPRGGKSEIDYDFFRSVISSKELR